MKPATFAVFVEYRNRTFRYATPTTGRNLWARSTAMKLVRANTHPPYQVARLVPESELSNWVIGPNQ